MAGPCSGNLPTARDTDEQCNASRHVGVGKEIRVRVGELEISSNGLVDSASPAGGGEPEAAHIERCKEWLALYARPSKGSCHSTSYGLKHRVERWLRRLKVEDTYVSNGAFIVAALQAGYTPLHLAWQTGPNVRFAMAVPKESAEDAAIPWRCAHCRKVIPRRHIIMCILWWRADEDDQAVDLWGLLCPDHRDRGDTFERSGKHVYDVDVLNLHPFPARFHHLARILTGYSWTRNDAVDLAEFLSSLPKSARMTLS